MNLVLSYPQGYYCKAGIKRPCPGGTYNIHRKQSKCTSVCPAGFKCPEGTAEPTQCQPGSYAIGGAVVRHAMSCRAMACLGMPCRGPCVLACIGVYCRAMACLAVS